MANPIYSITPFSLLDYPEKTACILWFAGCNMRCSYCYNPDIVLGKGRISMEETLAFLKSRKQLLQAVVLSGGECSSHPACLTIAQEAKAMGFLVKIDTNGSRPDRIHAMLEAGIIDYVALDFKAPEVKYKAITKLDGYSKFLETLKTLQAAAIPFEVRTTLHSTLLTAADIKAMAQVLADEAYPHSYYLQQFFPDTSTLGQLDNDYRPIQLEDLLPSPIPIRMRAH